VRGVERGGRVGGRRARWAEHAPLAYSTPLRPRPARSPAPVHPRAPHLAGDVLQRVAARVKRLRVAPLQAEQQERVVALGPRAPAAAVRVAQRPRAVDLLLRDRRHHRRRDAAPQQRERAGFVRPHRGDGAGQCRVRRGAGGASEGGVEEGRERAKGEVGDEQVAHGAEAGEAVEHLRAGGAGGWGG
jgi:hypothetical protein